MFYLKNANKEITSIEAVISFKGTKYKYQTGLSVNPNFWIKGSDRAKFNKSHPEGKAINDRLKLIEEAVTKTTEHFTASGKKPSAGEWRNKLRENLDGVQSSTHFVDYIQQYIDSREIKYETRKKYVTAINKLTDFEKATRQRLTFNDINIDFYNRFKNWFFAFTDEETGHRFSDNYFGSIIKVVKKIMNHALENGVHTNLKYKHSEFVVVAEAANTIYLNEEELQKIYNTPITEEAVEAITKDKRPHNIRNKTLAMQRAKQRFLIGAYTALRVSDFNRLGTMHIDGDYIKTVTTRTKKPVVIPIHPVVKEIIDNGGLDYKISEQKINKHIKEVCRLAGIEQPVTTTRSHAGKKVETTTPKYKLVTTHTARRSAATNMYKAGIGAINIMRLTGHTTERSFMKYIKITEEENAELLAKHLYFQKYTQQ